MPSAKITSKGQVTIPTDVRKALGLGVGDFIVFEVKADYAIVRRERPLSEVAAAARALGPQGPSGYPTDDEAILSAFESARHEELADELVEIPVTREDLE